MLILNVQVRKSTTFGDNMSETTNANARLAPGSSSDVDVAGFFRYHFRRLRF
jgi:hypothetical protein